MKINGWKDLAIFAVLIVVMDVLIQFVGLWAFAILAAVLITLLFADIRKISTRLRGRSQPASPVMVSRSTPAPKSRRVPALASVGQYSRGIDNRASAR